MTGTATEWTNAPPWFQWAMREIGVKETPGPKSTARILEYRKLGGIPLAGDDGDVPWCKIFVNAAIRQSGLKIQGNGMARSIEHDPNFGKLALPVLGCVVSMWRITKTGGHGHIGFYRGETADYVYLISGNAHDSVEIAPFPKDGKSMGVVGYYWPWDNDPKYRYVNFPQGPIIVRPGTPLTVPTVV